ncbi:unnamed protein product, partial [Vitis vinifera]|uniref:Uncharacterized protein n=1 Tax=Vitis vinifera TaxID=29760 RepID=D7SX59_VITVI
MHLGFFWAAHALEEILGAAHAFGFFLGSTCIGGDFVGSTCTEEEEGQQLEGRKTGQHMHLGFFWAAHVFFEEKKSGDKRENRAPNRPFFNLSSSLFFYFGSYYWSFVLPSSPPTCHHRSSTRKFLKKKEKPSFDLWVDILGSGLCWWAPKTLTCGLKFVFVGFKPFSFSLGLLVMFVWTSYVWV